MDKSKPIDAGPRFWHRPPPPDLRGLVTGIYAYAEGGEAMAGVVEAASLTVPLIINLGAPFRIGLGRTPTQSDRYGSFAAGLFAGPVIMESDGTAECIQVNFTPLGSRRFFGLPMHELAERMVPLADLGDRGIAQLSRRIAELDPWEARLDLAEDMIRSRLRQSVTVDPAVRWAFDSLAASRGGMRIGALCDRLEWSRRKVVEQFRREIGLPPKAVARILRFDAALAMARRAETPDWADIAAACSYADQAHLTREFSALAGRPPAAWRAAL